MPAPALLVDAAMAWHDAGVCVLPAADDGSKRPAVAWGQYQKTRPERDELGGWLDETEGIGLVCGTVSGNLEMFELEAAAVGLGLHTELRDLFAAAGFPDLWAKLQTYVEQSPAGGLHWIYRVDGEVPGNTKLARRRNPDTGVIEVLAETRGEGGWVVVAPSSGRTHPSGKAWQVLPGSQPGDIPTLTADEHQTLHRLAATLDQMPIATPAASEPVLAVVRAPGEKTPGDDFNERATWDDILIPAGWVRAFTKGATTYWRRPGKNVGVSATTGFGDQGYDLLYIFTTSTDFDDRTSYTKFGAYAVLNHNKDHRAAASALRKAGYGSPSTPAINPPLNDWKPSLVADVVAATTMPTDDDVPEDAPTWAEVDLTPFLDGSYVPQVPELLKRTDGICLVYAGRVHSFHGESESGKSWVALAVAAEQLLAGHRVVMLDFESDAHTVVGRLMRMGVPTDTLRRLFSYRRPEVAPNAIAREHEAFIQFLSGQYALVILDGVTDALGVFGVSSKENDEITSWTRSVPRRIAYKTGAAVVMIDHVTKDGDSRGRFAIGAQAKMATLDGSAFMVEVIDPLGVGLVGKLALRVAKDRPGGVRPVSGPYRKSDRSQESAIVTVDSTEEGVTRVRVDPQRETAAKDADGTRPFQPTALMERVTTAMKLASACMSRNAIASAVKGKREYIMQAIDCLETDGYIVADGPALKGGRPSLRLLQEYRAGDQKPVPDLAPFTPSADADGATRSRSRSKDRGTGGTGSAPSTTHSQEPVGTGREHLAFDPRTGEIRDE